MVMAPGPFAAFWLVAFWLIAFWLTASSARAETREIRFDIPGEIPLLAPDYGRDWAALVTVGEYAVTPRIVHLQEGQLMAWRGGAREGRRISFADDVVEQMRCPGLVNFRVESGRLRSGLLRHGDVAGFCSLAPGVYPYRIEGEDSSVRRWRPADRLRGVIVVTPAEPSDPSPVLRTVSAPGPRSPEVAPADQR